MSHTSLIPLFWDQRNFHTISYQLFTIFLFAFHLLLPDRYTKIVIGKNLVLCSAVSESLANGIPTAWVYIYVPDHLKTDVVSLQGGLRACVHVNEASRLLLIGCKLHSFLMY